MAAPKASFAPASLKLKTCVHTIRVAGEHVTCAQEYLGDERNCKNWSIHLTNYPTGHCQIGSHEGVRNLSYSGIPMKPCDFIVTCPCDCHDALDKLFALTDRPRVFVDSSGYVAPPREFWLPSDDPEWLSSLPAPGDVPRNDEDAAVAPVRGPMVPSYIPTPTGRAARGQLESWVHAAFQVWLIEQGFMIGSTEMCTPTWIATQIKKTEAIEPSVGAIDAVFKRWHDLGFAVMEKKPTRLVSITSEGKELGLWKMKDLAKRQFKKAKAEQRRGRLR